MKVPIYGRLQSFCSCICVIFLQLTVIMVNGHNLHRSSSSTLVWKMEFDKPVIRLFPVGSMVQILVTGIRDDVSSAVCQVHSQYKNFTLSLTDVPTHSTSVTGHNAGVVTVLTPSLTLTDVSWYLSSNQNESFNVLVDVVELTFKDPLPGGCNMEFNLENDPNFLFYSTPFVSMLKMQWSNVGYHRGGKAPPCSGKNSKQSQLSYKLYVYYIPEESRSEEHFFKALRAMLTPTLVLEYAHEFHTMNNDLRTKPALNMTSQRGQGAIYTGLVFDTVTGRVSSYIPVSSYSCDLTDKDSCQPEYDIPGAVLCGIGGIIGLVVCFLGHRFLKTGFFIFGFLTFTLATYICLAITTDLTYQAQLSISAGVGICGGVLWLLLWWCLGYPCLSVFLVSLVMGYLVTSILFFTPFTNLDVWQTDLNYGLAFACGILLLPILLLAFPRTLNIVCSALVGSYGIILVAAFWIQSSIKDVLLNSIKRQIVPQYGKAIHITPYQINDIILSGVWAVVFIVGLFIQFYRERGREHFPTSGRRSRQRPRISHQQHMGNDERQPLINPTAPPEHFPPINPEVVSLGQGYQSQSYGSHGSAQAPI